MLKKEKKKYHKKKTDLEYPHNPRYCMIMPDADDRDDDSIAPTCQS